MSRLKDHPWRRAYKELTRTLRELQRQLKESERRLREIEEEIRQLELEFNAKYGGPGYFVMKRAKKRYVYFVWRVMDGVKYRDVRIERDDYGKALLLHYLKEERLDLREEIAKLKHAIVKNKALLDFAKHYAHVCIDEDTFEYTFCDE